MTRTIEIPLPEELLRLVDEKAQLVGMNSATASGDVTGQNYAVGVDRINEMVPRILEGQNLCGG